MPRSPSRPAVPRQHRSTLGKLARPRLARIVPRARLIGRLDEGIGLPVTWVAGPPGAGKTTLVADYVQSRDMTALWILLDAGDSDLATFIHYVSHAALASGVGARARRHLPVPTPEDLRDGPGFARRYFRVLAEHARSPLVLVLDNYQELSESSPVHAALAAAAEQWPTEGRVIAISRTGPPPAFARSIALQQLAVVDAEALRFTLDETRALLALHASDQAPADLLRAADGWAAGLILMLAARASVERTEPASARQLVFDYFASEVFERMTHEHQAALVRLAVLPDMTTATADALAGSAAGSEVLADLYRRNLFTARRGASDPVYVFHALFREFLLARAERLVAPAEMNELRRRGGLLLAERGQIDDGLALLVEAGAWDDASALIGRHAGAYVRAERSQALRRWIEALPAAMRDECDNAYWLGACAMAENPAHAQASFELAYSGYAARGDEVGRLMAAAGAAECIAMRGVGMAVLDRWIEVFEHLAPAYFAIRDAEVELRVLPGMLAAFVGRQAHHRLTRILADRAERLLEEAPGARQRILFATVASCFVDTGQHERIERIIHRLDRRRDEASIAPATLLQWRLVQVYWKSLAGHLDDILDDSAALEVLALAPGLERLRCAAYTATAQARWVSGDIAGAWRQLALARATVDPSRTLDLGVLEFVTGTTCMAEGRYDTALAHLRLAVELAREAGSPGRERVASFSRACAAAWLGRLDEAQASLAEARAHPSYAVCTFHQWVIAMIDAFVADRAGDTDRTLASLRRGLSLAREGGYTFAPGTFGTGIMPRLLALALRHGIDVPLATRLIRLRGIKPPADDDVPGWPWPIVVRTLGGFVLERDREPVAVGRKEQRKPLDLLRLLIASGASGVNARQLAQVLWPDAAGDAAQNSFDNVLHRLRKLLGHERSVVLVDGGLTLDRSLCWTDVQALDEAIAHAGETIRADADAPARLRAAERILALYKGPFLAGDESYPPIIEARERLRARFLRQMAALAGTFESAGDWASAADLHRRVLEQDVLAEDVYRRLVVCYLRLDRRAEAYDALRRCRENLSIILGIRPGPEIEALAAQLKGNP